eukprot:7507072-Pyramimonas_sp.AAC.1
MGRAQLPSDQEQPGTLVKSMAEGATSTAVSALIMQILPMRMQTSLRPMATTDQRPDSRAH